MDAPPPPPQASSFFSFIASSGTPGETAVASLFKSKKKTKKGFSALRPSLEEATPLGGVTDLPTEVSETDSTSRLHLGADSTTSRPQPPADNNSATSRPHPPSPSAAVPPPTSSTEDSDQVPPPAEQAVARRDSGLGAAQAPGTLPADEPAAVQDSQAAAAEVAAPPATTGAESPSPSSVDGGRLAWNLANELERQVEASLQLQDSVLQRSSVSELTAARLAEIQAEIARVCGAQEAAVEAEDFEEAARLDTELRALQTAAAALTDTALLRDSQRVIDRCANDCRAIVERCVLGFAEAEKACVGDAITKVRFEAARTTGDVARLRFEAERLSTEATSVESQLSVVQEELEQVETQVEQLTGRDREIRDLAQEDLREIESEVERLKRELAEKEQRREEVKEAIQVCNMRIADARNKFQKQLHRLETSREQLSKARAEVQQDLEELARMRSQILSGRLELTGCISAALDDAHLLALAAELLDRRALAPLRVLAQTREQFFAETEQPSETLQQAAAVFTELRARMASTRELLASADKEEDQLLRAVQEAEITAQHLQEQRTAAVQGRHFLEAARLNAAMHTATSNAQGLVERLAVLEKTKVDLQGQMDELEAEATAAEQRSREAREAATAEVDAAAARYRKNLAVLAKAVQLYLDSLGCRGEEEQPKQPSSAASEGEPSVSSADAEPAEELVEAEAAAEAAERAEERASAEAAERPASERVASADAAAEPAASEEGASKPSSPASEPQAPAVQDDSALRRLEEQPTCAIVARVLRKLTVNLVRPLETELAWLADKAIDDEVSTEVVVERGVASILAATERVSGASTADYELCAKFLEDTDELQVTLSSL